jgi:hypothetical protein
VTDQVFFPLDGDVTTDEREIDFFVFTDTDFTWKPGTIAILAPTVERVPTESTE